MKEHHEFKVEEEYEYQGIKHERSMIKETFNVSRAASYRIRYEVLSALVEEVGELSTEVAITEGYSSKEYGPDGVIGEAIDIIICALDMIWVDSRHTTITEEELEDVIMRILKRKLEKWKEKTKQQQS